MGRRGRTALVLGAVAVAVLAWVVLRLGADEDVDAAGDWTYVSGTTKAGNLRPPAQELPTLTFDDDSGGGHTGCNSYGGPVEADGSALSWEYVEQTFVGCAGAVGSFERAYLDALGDVSRAERRGDRLVLIGDDVRLEFGPVPAWPRSAVVGHTWRLHALTDDSGDGVPIPAADRTDGDVDPAMLYLSDRGITANSGCRTLRGRWTEHNGVLVLTQASYRGECGPDPPQQEVWVMEVLGGFTASVAARDGAEELVLTAAGAQPDGTRRQLVYRR